MKKFNFILALSLLVLLLQSCGEEITVPQDPSTDNELTTLSLGANMVRSGYFNAKTKKVLVKSGPTSVSAPTTSNDIEGVYIKKTRIYKMGLIYTEHLLFNPMNSSLYPGSVFIGNSIATGEYIPVPNQKTAPITMTTSLVPMSPMPQGISKTVANISYAKYVDALNDWKTMDTRTPSASTEYELKEISSSKKLKSMLGIGYGTSITGNVDLGIDFNSKKNHILVKFIQKKFSVSMDIPEGGKILTSINKKDLQYTMPVYISDMFYGRTAYAVISSDESLTKLKAALHLVFPKENVNVDSDLDYESVLKNADVKAICIGGSSMQHGELIRNGWEGLKNFLADDIEANTAAPISFILKYADDNSVAKVLSSSEMPILESYFVPKSKSIEFSFRPEALQAKSGIAKKAQVHGKSTLKLPANSPLKFANNATEIPLLDVAKQDYISIANTNDFIDISYRTNNVEVEITRPTNMSMKEFLEQKVIVTSQYYSTDAYGNLQGASLGNLEQMISLKDLIFAAKHKELTVRIDANRLVNHSASIRFTLDYKTNLDN